MCNHDGKRLGIVVGIVGMLLKWTCMDFENLCVCVNLGFDFYQETHFGVDILQQKLSWRVLSFL